MKSIPSKKKLEDCLATREIKFIKNNKDLINKMDWTKLLIHAMDNFGPNLNSINTIFKFLIDNLPQRASKDIIDFCTLFKVGK